MIRFVDRRACLSVRKDGGFGYGVEDSSKVVKLM